MKSSNPFGVSFYIRKNKGMRRDYSIYCCIKVFETPTKEICLSSSIARDDWDLRKGRPKPKNDFLLKLSVYLDTVKAKLFDTYLDLKLDGHHLSADEIKKIYQGKGTHDYTVLGVIDHAIKKYEKELAKGSLKNYGATRTYVKAFCKARYKSGDVRLKFITYDFIDGLKTHILSHPIKPNDPCTHNGCMKHLERFKKIILWAYQMRYMDRDVFSAFRIKRNPYESKRLHWEQLKTLEQKVFQRPMLNLVKDLFVFCCYTGMAPADLQMLQQHQIYSESDGLKWLAYIRAKSKTPASVPLLNQAQELIKKYQWKKGQPIRNTVFPYVSNKCLNDSLKIISEVCEFGIALNFYVSRYTFATSVTLFHGVPLTSIKEMMGHRKIDSTAYYARVDKSVVGKDMLVLQEKIDS